VTSPIDNRSSLLSTGIVKKRIPWSQLGVTSTA
jgi:hypothetical protein